MTDTALPQRGGLKGTLGGLALPVGVLVIIAMMVMPLPVVLPVPLTVPELETVPVPLTLTVPLRLPLLHVLPQAARAERLPPNQSTSARCRRCRTIALDVSYRPKLRPRVGTTCTSAAGRGGCCICTGNTSTPGAHPATFAAVGPAR